jgi:hypothetical protein
MGIRNRSTGSVINLSVISIGTVSIGAVVLGIKPTWSVNVGTLLVSFLEATRLNMSRGGLDARFEAISKHHLPNKNMHGLYAIIPFILFLPFMAKLLLVTAATLLSAYEVAKPVR